jgi:hypothetical protein
MDKFIAELFVEVYDYFGIRGSAKPMTFLLQLQLELTVVVDFAVEDDLDSAVFVAQGLCSARQVDNRESPMGKPNSEGGPIAIAIRPAVGNSCRHLAQRSRFDRSDAIKINYTGYSTHVTDTLEAVKWMA